MRFTALKEIIRLFAHNHDFAPSDATEALSELDQLATWLQRITPPHIKQEELTGESEPTPETVNLAADDLIDRIDALIGVYSLPVFVAAFCEYLEEHDGDETFNSWEPQIQRLYENLNMNISTFVRAHKAIAKSGEFKPSWSTDPFFKYDEWLLEIVKGSTRLGYDEWVCAQPENTPAPE